MWLADVSEAPWQGHDRRLPLALLLSLLIHALLLSLTLGGGEGRWLPGFGFPWQERRIEVPDLSVVVVPEQVTAVEPATPVAVPAVPEPPQQAPIEQLVASPPAVAPSVPHAPTPQPTAPAIAPEANPATEGNPGTTAAAGPAPAQMPPRADRPSEKAPSPAPAPAVISVERADEPTWVVPAAPAMPVPVIAAVPSAPRAETATPSLQDDGNAARAENARVESERQEAARVEAAKIEAARIEAARVEAARVEVAKVEAAQVEAAKIEATKIEAAKIEAAKIEAAKIEAARVEAARVEAAKVDAARIEAAKVEAAKVESARVEAEKAEAAREERLRAIGRQLDQEADRRDAANAASRLLPLSSGARRYRLFGRTDPNAELIVYAEAVSRKIQQNMTFDMVRDAAKQPHTDPVVTLSIRSDGSVESVTFVRSSGVPALDDAIRSIVDSQRPYEAFPPGLASEFDVIEIRRTWYFDMAIRLY